MYVKNSRSLVLPTHTLWGEGSFAYIIYKIKSRSEKYFEQKGKMAGDENSIFSGGIALLFLLSCY